MGTSLCECYSFPSTSKEALTLSERSNGTILRFTPLVDEDSGPQKPVNATVKHPQGTVLDVREGHLIVAFKEADMWLLGEEEYR